MLFFLLCLIVAGPPAATTLLVQSKSAATAVAAPSVAAAVAEIERKMHQLQMEKENLLMVAEKNTPSSSPPLTVYRSSKFAQQVQYNVTYAQGLSCNDEGFGGHCKPIQLVLDIHTPIKNDTVGLQPQPVKPGVRAQRLIDGLLHLSVSFWTRTFIDFIVTSSINITFSGGTRLLLELL